MNTCFFDDDWSEHDDRNSTIVRVENNVESDLLVDFARWSVFFPRYLYKKGAFFSHNELVWLMSRQSDTWRMHKAHASIRFDTHSHQCN